MLSLNNRFHPQFQLLKKTQKRRYQLVWIKTYIQITKIKLKSSSKNKGKDNYLI